MKVIFDTDTQNITPYPRNDDSEIVGLASNLLVMDVVHDALPTFDKSTHKITQTKTIDLANSKIIYGWDIIALSADEVVKTRKSLIK
jgi:hypothetical protein